MPPFDFNYLDVSLFPAEYGYELFQVLALQFRAELVSFLVQQESDVVASPICGDRGVDDAGELIHDRAGAANGGQGLDKHPQMA